MNNDIAFIQQFINEKAGTDILIIDGVGGPKTREAFLNTFVCKDAVAITQQELNSVAKELGDTDTKRINAVAKTESNGSGWFNSGHPKILFERHLFWKQTKNPKIIRSYSNPTAGGYSLDYNKNGIADSWEKLSYAVCDDPMAALMSISIGKFQVLGKYFYECGYKHPIDMLYDASRSEYSQYMLLVNYILKVANLKSAFLKISKNPDDCIAFATGYNGKGFRKFNYHKKIASFM